jgi:hypothetical protein
MVHNWVAHSRVSLPEPQQAGRIAAQARVSIADVITRLTLRSAAPRSGVGSSAGLGCYRMVSVT